MENKNSESSYKACIILHIDETPRICSLKIMQFNRVAAFSIVDIILNNTTNDDLL